MEPSINTKKVKAMNKYKMAMAKFAYNLALYTLTSIITCFFFSSPFWLPSITNHFFIIFPTLISICSNAKFFFLLGNLIIIILLGDSRLKQSPTSDFYDEYVARSQSIDGSAKTLIVEEMIKHHEDNKKEMIKLQGMPRGVEKKKGMRSCKSEVWGEKARKEEGERKVKPGMRSSKSAVWSEGETTKVEKAKGKKEEQSTRMDDEEKKLSSRMKGKREEQYSMKNGVDHQEKSMKVGMRSSKSAVWGEREIAEREKGEGVKIEEDKKMGMRSSKSAVWGESEIEEREEGEGAKKEENKKMGMMRSCRSEIWSESEIKRLGKSHVEEEEQQLNVFNKRVEDFIARVNKQRLLEAKIVDHSKGS